MAKCMLCGQPVNKWGEYVLCETCTTKVMTKTLEPAEKEKISGQLKDTDIIHLTIDKRRYN